MPVSGSFPSPVGRDAQPTTRRHTTGRPTATPTAEQRTRKLEADEEAGQCPTGRGEPSGSSRSGPWMAFCPPAIRKRRNAQPEDDPRPEGPLQHQRQYDDQENQRKQMREWGCGRLAVENLLEAADLGHGGRLVPPVIRKHRNAQPEDDLRPVRLQHPRRRKGEARKSKNPKRRKP